ncbi:MAG: contractile injection system tape measure protein [Reichenbachiella sp.]|uniref:contractile injection system tape measure protein n=2 Tax=Reichenbachiella sp. TaxID=2184521 RepID=UPI003299A8EB
MNGGTHTIKSKIFEVSFNLEDESLDFQKRMSDVIRTELSTITDQCLALYDSPVLQYINRIELDLGDIPYDNFEKILPGVFLEKFSRVLNTKLVHEGPDRIEQDFGESSLISMMRHFLIKGYMPWNFNQERWHSFNDMFRKAFSSSRKPLIKDLNVLLKSTQVRTRLILQLDNRSIADLVREVEPSQSELILNYHTRWCDVEKKETLFGRSLEDASKRFWEFIFNYLYEERGSYFNTRSFLMSTLRQLAGTYNLALSHILLMLKNAQKHYANHAKQAELNQLLGEIISSWDLDKEQITKKVEVKEDVLSLEELSAYLHSDHVTGRNKEDYKRFEKSLSHFLTQRRSGLIALIKSNATEYRWTKKFVELMGQGMTKEVIQLLEPTNYQAVIAYHSAIVKEQQSNGVVPESSQNFPNVLWTFIMCILADNHGSSFNHKVFVKNLIHKTANHYNLSYVSLITLLKEGLTSVKDLSTTHHVFDIIDQLFDEEIMTTQEVITEFSYEGIDWEWIEESVTTGEVHSIFRKEGIYSVRDLLKGFVEESPQEFHRFLSIHINKSTFVKGLVKVSDNSIFEKIVASSGRSNRQDWRQMYSKISQLPFYHLVNFGSLQEGLVELMIRCVLSGSDSSLFERQVIDVSRKSGVAFDQVLKALLWLNTHANDESLSLWVNQLAIKFNVQEIETESFDVSQNTEDKSVDHEEIIQVVISGIKGIVNRTELSKYGFRSVDDLLIHLLKKPGQLKRVLSNHDWSTNSFIGIGREISLSTFYKLLSVLDKQFGRKVTQLLRTLEINLNLGQQSTNRFLASARQVALVSLVKNNDAKPAFVEEFAQLVLGTAPAVYLQVIPVLSKKLSALSLPAEGNLNKAIESIESNLTSLTDQNVSLDLDTIKKMISEDFFEKTPSKESTVIPYFDESADVLYDEIYLENAGLALLNPYLPTLFERCLLTEDGKFISRDHQEQAVLLLQHLMLDDPLLDEHQLPLNKVLCGLPVDAPIRAEIDVNKNQREMLDGLINAVIDYWSIIGSSSIEGFRGSWLWRKGKLEHREDSWELRVEQNSYDMLMDHLPFSITPIKYSWMDKPINVSWR